MKSIYFDDDKMIKDQSRNTELFLSVEYTSSIDKY